jgi:16S rRNA processing protein RimM
VGSAAAVAARADLREVVVGVVGRAHGVRGEVAVSVRTDEPERRFAPGQVLRVEDEARVLTVRSARDHSGRLLVAFAEITDRTGAESLRGIRLVTDVPAAELPSAEGEFYDRQLIGLQVRSAESIPLGTVTGVVHLPAQDVLEVDVDGVIRLVPFVTALVPHVDLLEGYLQLADVAGLVDDLTA